MHYPFELGTKVNETEATCAALLVGWPAYPFPITIPNFAGGCSRKF